jgi:sugar-specific transcriptional regulator TrmB
LLARYVQHFPAEAVLIAQRQDKFQQEIEQAEQEMKNISRSSERQER